MTAVTRIQKMGRLVTAPKRPNVLGTNFCDRGLPFMLSPPMRFASGFALLTTIPEPPSPSFKRRTSRHPVYLAQPDHAGSRGRRTHVPLLADRDHHPSPCRLLTRRRVARYPNTVGMPLRRNLFRARVWKLTLLRSGPDATSRFHDLRHSYAIWLVDDGVPVNMVQRVLGHERAATTLDLYTRRSDGEDRILQALDSRDEADVEEPW